MLTVRSGGTFSAEAPQVGGMEGLCVPDGTSRDARKTQIVKVFGCCAGECGFYLENYGESLEGFEQRLASRLPFRTFSLAAVWRGYLRTVRPKAGKTRLGLQP